MKEFFTLAQVSSSMQEYAKRYLLRVIASTSLESKNDRGFRKKGIALSSLDEMIECGASFPYEDDQFSRVEKRQFKIKGRRILVGISLGNALDSLSSSQQDVLLKSIVLKIPIKLLAKELHVSSRMVDKHKHNAIVKMRDILKKDEN